MKRLQWKKKKNINKKKRRNWTVDERKAFCDILVDRDDDFVYKLERLALNKSSNRELFEEMQVKFAKILRENSFIEMNKQNFKLKDGKIKEYEPLDTTIDKLRVQYKNLRAQWSAIASEPKQRADYLLRQYRSGII